MAVRWRSRVFIEGVLSRRRRLSRAVTVVAAVSLTATLSDVVALPERAAAKPKPKPAATCPDQRADRVSAAVTARLCKKRVEITDETTESSQLWANPDGSFSSRVYRGPVRVRQGDRWVPADPTLRKAPDGSVVAVAHPRGLRLSGAAGVGTHDLATVDVAGEALAMRWQGALPEPALEGARATYRDVLPGVDLVVQATLSGFEQFLMVKDRAAATRVATLRLPLKSKSLRFVNDAPGAFAITDAAGKAVGRIPTPVAWDSAPVPAEAGPGEARPARAMSVASRSPKAQLARPATAKPAPAGKMAAAGVVDAADGTGELTLEMTPDAAWLADPARVFPVTLDPQVRAYPAEDTYINDTEAIDRSGASDLQVGHARNPNTNQQWNLRTLMIWDTARLPGARVKSATLHLWNFYSRQCAPVRWNMHVVTPFTIPVAWQTGPSWGDESQPLSSSDQTRGFNASCSDNWVHIDAQPFFQWAADRLQTTAYMGLKAADESTTAGYKQFRSSETVPNQVPHADINYDSVPVVSDLGTNPGTAGCVTGPNRPYLRSATPQLQAKVADDTAGSLSANFEWWVSHGQKIGSTTVSNVPANTVASAQVPAGAFVDGGTYAWHVQAVNGGRVSPWSPWCEFTVDTSKPGTPFVSSSLYPPVSQDNTWGHGGAGQAGQFTLAGAGMGSKLPAAEATGSAACAPSETPDKVIDGSVAANSKWCSGAADKWVQVQLAAEQTVGYVVLRHAQVGGETAVWNTRDYDVQTSLDGQSWSTAVQVRGNTLGVSTHQFPAPVRARYIKIVVLKPSQNNTAAARIYEVEAYGNVPSSDLESYTTSSTPTRPRRRCRWPATRPRSRSPRRRTAPAR